MKFSFAAVLIVAILAAAAFAFPRNHPLLHDVSQAQLTAGDAKYTYVLAMNRAAPGEDLTLHGNWPWMQSCIHAPRFDSSFVEPILADMDKFWPSYNRANLDFWEHEWTKHLTCEYAFRNGTKTPTQIFVETIDLLHRYTPACDNRQLTDCRCTLDINFELIGKCKQK